MTDKDNFVITLPIPEATLRAMNPAPAVVQFDPLGKYPGIPKARLADACGLLPHFVLTDDAPILANLEACYQFGIHENQRAMIDPDGMYHYPGDPDMAPFAVVRKGTERMFIYPNGVVAILGDDGSAFVTRLD